MVCTWKKAASEIIMLMEAVAGELEQAEANSVLHAGSSHSASHYLHTQFGGTGSHIITTKAKERDVLRYFTVACLLLSILKLYMNSWFVPSQLESNQSRTQYISFENAMQALADLDEMAVSV